MPFDPSGYRQSKKKAFKALDFMRSQIAEHKKTIDYNNPRDFIDSFLIEMKKDVDGSKDFTGKYVNG